MYTSSVVEGREATFWTWFSPLDIAILVVGFVGRLELQVGVVNVKEMMCGCD